MRLEFSGPSLKRLNGKRQYFAEERSRKLQTHRRCSVVERAYIEAALAEEEAAVLAGAAAGGVPGRQLSGCVGENIRRYPMSLLVTSLECHASKLVHGDTCPRPTTGGGWPG